MLLRIDIIFMHTLIRIIITVVHTPSNDAVMGNTDIECRLRFHATL